MSEAELRLFGAREAASILHIRVSAVYEFWKRGLLDYWDLNGTKSTNLRAISEFLERMKKCEGNQLQE